MKVMIAVLAVAAFAFAAESQQPTPQAQQRPVFRGGTHFVRVDAYPAENGHIVEGHVPISDVERMLKQGAAVTGLAVPGMPIGSPGMEVPGTTPQPFNVIAFDKTGSSRVFATYGRG